MLNGENKIKEASPIKAGLRCKCPVCKEGRLFRAYLKVADNCDRCGADFSFEDTGDGAAPFIMIFVGFIVAISAVVTEVKFEPPFWVHIALWFPFSMVLVMGLLQPLKGVMINLQYHHSARGTTYRDVEKNDK